MGFLRHDVDGSARGALAELRALRAAKDLDPFYVTEVQAHSQRVGKINAVDIGQHAGLRGEVLGRFPADAANGHDTAGAVVFRDNEPGHVAVEVVQSYHVGFVEVRAGQHGYRNGRILQRHLAFARAHHDLLQD